MVNLIKILLVLMILENIIKLFGMISNIIYNVGRAINDEASEEENKMLRIQKDKKINDNNDLKQFLFIRSEK